VSAEGTIFEVREFCLHDGPGIRTTVFFKGCPLRCAWCHNPEGLDPEPHLLVNRTGCAACGACRKACGHPDACVACGACAAVCPQGCRRLCGRRVSASILAAELRVHETFFARYGGGVTFSGGEPLAQPEFLMELAGRLRSIHLAIETSGYAPAETYRRVANHVDLVLQDLKHPDPDMHKRYAGVDVVPILENLAWLKASGRPFVARIPLIPGVNDAPETLARFAELLRGRSGLIGVELLPYHLTAGAKYALLGRRYEPPFDHTRSLAPDLSVFITRGLPCRVL
jgi:pyruvate formate lyase activating enzyme